MSHVQDSYQNEKGISGQEQSGVDDDQDVLFGSPFRLLICQDALHVPPNRTRMHVI